MGLLPRDWPERRRRALGLSGQEIFRRERMGDWTPVRVRCERKREYPLGDLRDRCLNEATHRLVMPNGKDTLACQICAAAYVQNMSKNEEVRIARI